MMNVMVTEPSRDETYGFDTPKVALIKDCSLVFEDLFVGGLIA